MNMSSHVKVVLVIFFIFTVIPIPPQHFLAYSVQVGQREKGQDLLKPTVGCCLGMIQEVLVILQAHSQLHGKIFGC